MWAEARVSRRSLPVSRRGPLPAHLCATPLASALTSASGGLYAYRLGLERPLSRSFPPFDQRSLSAQLRRPRTRSATSAIRRFRPSLGKG